jgi:hypothetical protein
MAPQSPFPTYARPTLSHDDLVGYLAQQKTAGWDVFQGDAPGNFIIPISDCGRVLIIHGMDRCQVQGFVGDTIRVVEDANNLASLDHGIREAVRYIANTRGIQLDWPSKPTTVRTYEGQVAQNLSKVVSLIGASTIDAIYDPYFENKSFQALFTFASFGVRIASSVRILTSTKKFNTQPTSPLLKHFSDGAFAQLAPQGEIRFSSYTGHKRRFLLLSGGQSLLLGFSLNSFDVTEAPALQGDAVDRPFFDGEWAQATPIT